jgi:hypothetical protein
MAQTAPPLTPGFEGHFSAEFAQYGLDEDSRDHLSVHLWKVREAGKPERCSLKFSLDLRSTPPIQASGEGPIPCSAVRFDSDSATLDVNLSVLPSSFILGPTTAGWFKVEWRRDLQYEVSTTGTRHLTEGGVTSHWNGTIHFFSTSGVANYNSRQLPPAVRWAGTGITEYKQTQKVKE